MAKLGKYEIRRELGRGAMGVVYEAYDPLIGRVVALKTIRSDQVAGDASADLLARFKREAQAAGRLTHPNIVSIYDFAEDGGTWFIAMEFVRGRDLKSYFEANERFPAPTILRIMAQILDALDYSHRQGVVHRDIKPANIFLLPDGSVKVADFGIAHVESSDLTAVGTVLGTPSYMSPEQIMGLPVDGRSDLFSAGVILYQFLTGDRPFSGSVTTTMQKVLREDPLPPSSLNLQIPAGLDAVIRKALAKRPEERFQSAQEFATALREAGAADFAPQPAATVVDPDATVRAAPNTPSATIVPKAAATATLAAAARPAAAGATGRSSAFLFTVAAVVIAVAAGAWWNFQRPHERVTASIQVDDNGKVAIATAPAGESRVRSGDAATTSTQAATPELPVAPPGSVVVAAVGVVDGNRPQYAQDRARLAGDLREDAKSQAVEKALGLLVERSSLARNYDVLQRKLLANSGTFIKTVVQESEPQQRQDGLVSMRTQAIVDVRALQKSLNQMTRDERIELIRANGDPRISVRIAVQDADHASDAPASSPVAENVLKERIRSFGFRTWADETPATDAGAANGPDFSVVGEAKVKRLSAKLQASGLTVTKYALTSWTVKCTDRTTGEEIYHNTTLPKGTGSWPTEEAALSAIGSQVAGEFSRDFFLQHVAATSSPVRLTLDGLPDAHIEDLVAGELVGLPAILSLRPITATAPHALQLQVAGRTTGAELAPQLAAPLNAKLGQACFSPGATSVEQVTLRFDPRCAEPSILSRLESNPPASLYGAPAGRLDAVVSNPDTRRKLTI